MGRLLVLRIFTYFLFRFHFRWFAVCMSCLFVYLLMLNLFLIFFVSLLSLSLSISLFTQLYFVYFFRFFRVSFLWSFSAGLGNPISMIKYMNKKLSNAGNCFWLDGWIVANSYRRIITIGQIKLIERSSFLHLFLPILRGALVHCCSD